MGTKKLLGIIGSVLLFLGVFMPIVSMPIIGNMNYFQNGKGDGTIILILAGISLVLVLAEKFKGLWLTGLGSLGIMIFTFVNFQTTMSQVKTNMETELEGNIFRRLGDLTIRSVQLQWGWAILIVGVTLVIAVAAMKEEGKDYIDSRRLTDGSSKRCPDCLEIVDSQARVCKFCRHAFTNVGSNPKVARTRPKIDYWKAVGSGKIFKD